MNNTTSTPILRCARRAVATLALCVAVAAATASLTGGPAQAGKSARAETSPRVTRPAAHRAPTRVAEKSDRGPALTVRGKTLRGKLNINTATEEQLRMLPGIGPSKARRILENRTRRGKFQRVRDLRRVKGIGYKTLKRLEPYLATRGETTLSLQ